MTKSIEEILKELKNKRSTVFSFNLSIDEVKELEKHRVKFSHEVGKILGSARIDMLEGKGNYYKTLKITKIKD